jgi:hypothetical protein
MRPEVTAERSPGDISLAHHFLDMRAQLCSGSDEAQARQRRGRRETKARWPSIEFAWLFKLADNFSHEYF